MWRSAWAYWLPECTWSMCVANVQILQLNLTCVHNVQTQKTKVKTTTQTLRTDHCFQHSRYELWKDKPCVSQRLGTNTLESVCSWKSRCRNSVALYSFRGFKFWFAESFPTIPSRLHTWVIHPLRPWKALGLPRWWSRGTFVSTELPQGYDPDQLCIWTELKMANSCCPSSVWYRDVSVRPGLCSSH